MSQVNPGPSTTAQVNFRGAQTVNLTLAQLAALATAGTPVQAGVVVMDVTTTPATFVGISDGAGGSVWLLRLGHPVNSRICTSGRARGASIAASLRPC